MRQRLAMHPPEEMAVSAVTVEESLRGRLALLARRMTGDARIHAYAKLIETVHFINSLSIVPFDADCEGHFQSLQSLRLRVGTQDLKIAAAGLAYNRVVVTRNRRDFERIPNLPIEDWSEG